MTPSHKTKLLVRIQDPQTARELKKLLPEECDLLPVHDLKSVESFCVAQSTQHTGPQTAPHALIVDLTPQKRGTASASNAHQTELVGFLSAVRQLHPVMRRVVIADHDDLATTIHGLHSGAIDSLLHRPFAMADLWNALRLHRVDGHIATGATAGTLR